MRRRHPSAAWDLAYAQERDATIVWRLRWAVALCILCLAVSCGDVALASPAAAPLRLKFLGALLALSVGVGLASLLPDGRRRPRALAVVFAIGIVLTLDVYSLVIPSGVEIAGASLAATVMGFAILLPWGAVPQAIVGVTAVGAYQGLWLLGPGDTSALLSIVVSSAIVGMVGASLLDRYRRAAYVHAWQQQRLAALAHDLGEQETPHDVAARLLVHGSTLLAADVCVVAVLGPSERQKDLRTFRVVHAAGAGSLHEQFVGFELPLDSPLLAEILRWGTVVMPGDAPESELGRIVASQPDVQVLYVALQRGSEPLGIVGWVRRGGFSTEEVALAERIVDPAALALKTARLLADLRESSRLRSEFVSTVSHELRTPLNVILGYADIARDLELEPAERRRCLDRIEGAGRELLTLIESTLDVGRLEAARSPLRIETVHLPTFWSELRQACARMPHASGVRLEWSHEAPDLGIRTDPYKLSVIVRNLVGNALKFTTEGHVRARLALDGEALLVEVSDTGIGIRPEDHTVIFELFRQADGSDARRFGGTGLGLYIVHRFAEQLGAIVGLESAPGAGSVFRVRLPIDSMRDEPAGRAAA